MKSIVFTSLLIISSIVGFSQSQKTHWRDIKVVEFTSSLSFPDSLEICGGEGLVRGKANNLKELSSFELRRIKKKFAKHSCDVIYIDTKKYYPPKKGKLYILGLK